MFWLFRLVAKYWYQLSLSGLTVITVFSLLPLSELPEFSGSDKTHHLVAYGALMFPVALRKPKYWLWIAYFFITWSGVIELVQPLVNRYGEWLDLLANTVGVLVGTTLGLGMRSLIKFESSR